MRFNCRGGAAGVAWKGLLTMAVAGVLSSGLAADLDETTPLQDETPLQVEASIALGNVRGRIDHLAVDLRRHRLYVAELGNDTLGAVDIEQNTATQRIGGLREPQGVAYVPATDEVWIANAADGTVRVLRGAALTEASRIKVGDDPDNLRVASDGATVYVGYGTGGIATIDARTRKIVRTLPLPAHPEAF